jgi:membrane dipeptidase
MRRAFLIAAMLGLGACRQTPTEGPSPEPPIEAPPTGQADTPQKPAGPETPQQKADRLAHEFLILDGHVDVPWRLEKSKAADGSLTEDVGGSAPDGDFDYVRARAGGLDAPFMSIYVSAEFENNGAKKVAEGLIAMVEGIVAGAPDKFALARTPAEVEANFASGKISLPMGLENGAPIERDLANVEYFFDRGIRYITLAHSKHNHISDSSYQTGKKHDGLSKFGRKVVSEMNRVGIMVDVSHISDAAFWDVMEVTKAPVIASHSSCRHFTPGWQRNMSDDMIEALAKNGGVIQINFGSGFLDDEIRKRRDAHREDVKRLLMKEDLDPDHPDAKAVIDQYEAEHPSPIATVERVADHIDHVVQLVGIDHVGLGSDFDGVGDSLPEGLEDVSKYPNLIRVLLERGYSDGDIDKLCGKNVLRVWRDVEKVAQAS